MSKKVKWIIFSLLGIIVLFFVLKGAGVVGKKEDTKVAVEKAGNRSITETVNASGKIYPEVEVKVSPDVSGEITELTVQEGDSVTKGQVLARIYADIYNTQRDQAAAQVSQQAAQVSNVDAQIAGLKAAVQQQQSNYERQKKLLDQKVISRAEFESAENSFLSAQANLNAAVKNRDASQASVRSAQANLQGVNKNLSRTTITAPTNGVISLLNIKKGERVVGTAQNAGTEMMRIADMRSMEVRVDVTENDIPKVHIGDSADVNVDAYIGRKFKGVVYQIASSQNGAASASANVANTANDVTNYKVYIRLDYASYADLMDPAAPKSFPFRPGMTASADIKTKTHASAMAVPINAVTTRDKGDNGSAGKEAKEKKTGPGADEAAPGGDGSDEKDVVVFILERSTSTVKKVVVKTGIQDTKYIEIVSGLKGGEEVISEPYNTIYRTLNNGMKVTVVPKEQLFEAKK